MKAFSLILLSIFTLTAYAQQVQNVKAQQQGSKVLVTYDLKDQPDRPYYVKLLLSKDGGATFGEELNFVSGDVKNTKAGNNKKITWDAAKEVGYFEGDAVFRVEATLKAAPMPPAIDLKCNKVDLISAKVTGNRLVIDFQVIPLADSYSSIFGYNENVTYIIDNRGNKHKATGGKFGDARLGENKDVFKGIYIRSQLVFDNVDAEITNIPVFKVYIFSNGGCYTNDDTGSSFQFRNVPVTR